MSADGERAAKRPKRTYRACYPCRSRKLKCSFGDPNLPWDGPCERCMREQRDCVRAKATFVRDAVPRKSDAADGEALSVVDLERDRPDWAPEGSSANRIRRDNASHRGGMVDSPSRDDGDEDDDDDNVRGPSTLVSSKLQNPSDALKLLASASSLRYHTLKHPHQPRTKASAGNTAPTWYMWAPVRQGSLTVLEARALFSFFESEMAPLYPLLHPVVFDPDYLETLVKAESLLLGAIIVIAARYSKILPDDRGIVIHQDVAEWVRRRILAVMDGEPSLRSVSSVEALLLLSEWPMLPVRKQPDDDPTDPLSDEAVLLQRSVRYDAYSWAYIGMAVRLAQELGIHDFVTLSLTKSPDTDIDNSWKQTRMLRTWVYCYNADRHIAIRLGRNAVLQAAMSSRWWESFSAAVAQHKGPANDVWASNGFMLGSSAQLLGHIQDHLYPSKEVTRSVLNSGVWEGFLRSVRLEIRYARRLCQTRLQDGSTDAALLRIELDYVVLYAYSLALRALQGKLRRRRLANDMHYQSPSLLNLVEGPWIMDALSAARSILEVTLTVLEERNCLRYCPSRIFQYVLFATTFLYKAMAAGMVEHGEQNMAGMLDKVVTVLGNAAIDDQHFLHGFAVLLKRLGKHWRSDSGRQSPSVLNRSNKRESEDFGPVCTNGTGRNHSAALRPPPISNQDSHGGTNGRTEFLPSTADCGDEAPVTGGLADLPGMPTLPSGEDFIWNFDPTFQMPAADYEQDMLFQSIWDNSQQDSVSSSNLYATLLGDTLCFPQGFESGT